MSEKEKMNAVTIRLVDAPSFKLREGNPKNMEDAIRAVADELRLWDREVFGVLNLSGKGDVINFNIVSIGDISTATVHPREAFKGALLSNAAKTIVFHNHPSGDYTPSWDDLNASKRLIAVGDILGIEVLDHIIVAGGTGDYLSLQGEDYVNFSNHSKFFDVDEEFEI